MGTVIWNNQELAIWGSSTVLLVWLLLLLLRRIRFVRSWLRIVVFMLLLVAVAGPKIETSDETRRATVLVDISESLDEKTGERLIARARELFPGDTEIEYLPFSSTVAPEADSRVRSFAALKSSWFKLNTGGTNLEAALRSPLLGRAGSIVVVSDGFETVGDARSTVALLNERAQSLSVVAPEPIDIAGDFSVVALHAALVSPRGKSVPIHVAVANHTGSVQNGTLVVTHGEKVLTEKNVVLAANAEASFSVLSDPASEGIKDITATLRPAEKGRRDSSRTIYLAGQAGEKVVLLHGGADDARFLGEALKDQAYVVDEMIAGSAGLSTIDLSKYSVVVLNNIPRAALPVKLQADLPNRIRSGTGFVMIGGNQSFGLGGYVDSGIAQLLPVEVVPPQTTKKRLNVAVALVLDKSRSMAADDRIEFAKEGARQVIQNLKDEDYVTVIGFDAAPFIVVKMGQVGQIRDEAVDRVGRLFPSNRTNMLPAIDEGRRALERAPAGRKHMIIMTDGRVPDAGPYYVELIKQMRLLGITVSTVMVGGEVDEGFLNSLADQGGGSFYQASDPRSLPRIFLADVKVNTGERTMKEGGDYQVVVGSDLRATSLRNFPALRGFVETKPRAENVARRELDIVKEGKREPLLASWRVGQGTSVAFTSDANGRWSNQWVSWARFRQFWSDVVGAARRNDGATETANFELRTTVDRGALILDLSLYDDLSDRTSGTLIAPDGSAQEILFNPISRGHVSAKLPNVKPGKYEFRGKVGDRRLTPVAVHVSGDFFGEQQGRGANVALLSELVAKTGGSFNPAPGAVQLVARQTKQEEYFGGWLALGAVLVLLLDIMRRERR